MQRSDRIAVVVAILLLTCVLGAAASAAAAGGDASTALLLCAVASVTLGLGARGVVGHWTALTVMFCGFFALYGLSGPLNAIMGKPLADIFAFPYRTTDFLQQQAHATIGLAVGMLLTALVTDGFAGAARSATPENARRWWWPSAAGTTRTLDLPFSTALLCLVIGSVFELVTLVRVGGLPVIAMGKAAYQSRAADLTMSLPSLEMVSIGIGLSALWFGRHGDGTARRERIMRGLLIFAAGLPVFAITLALGRRGPLFGWALVWIVGRSVYKPLRSIPLRLVAAGVSLVVASGLLFASRASLGYGVGTGDWRPFIDAITDVPKVVAAVNPADSEFGAPFGNYSEFAARAVEAPRHGRSYLAGLSTLIPGALYPGTKPKTITYEFRDRYFPSEAARGGIAGTGFSSILEAFMNFGSAGVFGVYALVAAALLMLERLPRLGPYAGLFYLQLIPVTQAFHRSELSLALGTALLSLLLLLFVRGCALAFTLLSSNLPTPSRGVQYV